jgi:hypothetical protein
MFVIKSHLHSGTCDQKMEEICRSRNIYLHAQPGDNCHIAERECLVEGFFQFVLTDKSR